MHVNSISHLVSQNQAKASSQVKPRQELAAKVIEDSYTPASNHPSEHPNGSRAREAASRGLALAEDGNGPSLVDKSPAILELDHQGDASPEGRIGACPGFDLTNLDRTVSPTVDFYQFAMGGYLARKPIPEDRERYGVDDELTQRNDAALKEILGQLGSADSYEPNTIEQKLADLFRSGMDVDAIEKAGLNPIAADLDRIADISSRAQLESEVARTHKDGGDVYFSFYGTADVEDASRVIGEFSQGGLSLPEPEYYTDPDNKEVLAEFTQHVERTFLLSGLSQERSRREAELVVGFEAKLAGISLSTSERRDPNLEVNKKSLAQLGELSQAFDWPSYLGAMGIEEQDAYNVATPAFFSSLKEVLEATPLATHKAYLRWHLLNAYATELPAAFRTEHFDFYGKTMRGLQQDKPRLDRVVQDVDSVLGEALGAKFVAKKFSPQAKRAVSDMVESFKSALTERISHLSWMGSDSKKGALAKIDALRAKVGYPDSPLDYSGLEIGHSYLDNIRNSNRYQRTRNLAKIGKAVDKNEWEMTASTNNAYYQPTNNEICLPAGILQPPYFELSADPAFNFGGIGATIGHELGHGFDDEGALFDAEGKLNSWMSPQDLEKFKHKAKGVEEQFDECIVEGLPVNGKLVLGEAMADLSGLELAYQAYKIATIGQPEQLIDGFTPDQRFFLAYAQSWATNLRPEYAKLMLKSDPHPHPKLRVNATLSNMTAFYEAFGILPGQKMRRPEEKRNEIWK